MSEKPKIKLSELTDMYDIEKDDKTPEEKTLEQVSGNFSMEIEEVIQTAEKKQEKEFREEDG